MLHELIIPRVHKCVFLGLVKNIGDARAASCNLFPLKVVLALNLYLVEVVLRLSNLQRRSVGVNHILRGKFSYPLLYEF